MKRNNKKFLTMMLASALCAATVGGLTTMSKVTANAAEASTYELSEVFAKNNATLGANEAKATTFTFSKTGSVNIKRNLALKWYEAKGEAKYLTVKFAFDDFNFEKAVLSFDTASAWATKDDKTTNSLTFEKSGSGISVKVNDGEAKSLNVKAKEDITFALAEGDTDGQFKVKLNGTDIGAFENIGENYAKYTYNSDATKQDNPFKIEVTMPEADEADEDAEDTTAQTSVFVLKEINGQSFENITVEDDSYLVTDNAAPVLVVNESLGGFLLGTKFTLNYEKVDVLQSSNLTGTTTYYQWNPAKEGEITADDYTKATSSDLHFFETPYNDNTTTIFEEFGKEWVSMKITLSDKVFKDDEGEFAKKSYDLSWYASQASVESKDGIDYIVLDRNEEGAKYTHLQLNDEEKKNEIIEEKKAAYEESLKAFQNALNENANGFRHGSSQSLTIPSVKWLIDDNNGFRNLNFVIAYKTPSSASEKTSNLSYSALKIPVKTTGKYEFKIYANDKASNAMQYYLDGELVDVDSSNIWDIEEIPTFSFEIAYTGLKVNEGTIKVSETVDDTYTLSGITVIGANSTNEAFALYKIDEEKAAKIGLTDTVLTSVTYEKLNAKIELTSLQDSYIELYLNAYKELLAEKLGGDVKAEDLDDCFVEIEEFDDAIDEEKHEEEWNKNNKYNWKPSSKSFTVAESGKYLIIADYSEKDLPLQRVSAYKLIVAETEADIYEGTSDFLDWVENNVVSVILFGVAGVMLILIIILLFIKPADETLEEVDEKAAKSKKKDKKDKE